MTLLQLNPCIPLDCQTPDGWKSGLAHFIVCDGPEHHLVWHVCMDETGEWWSYENPKVRGTKNFTYGRRIVADTSPGAINYECVHGVSFGKECKSCRR